MYQFPSFSQAVFCFYLGGVASLLTELLALVEMVFMLISYQNCFDSG